MMRGDLGQPPGGWPEVIQAKVLKGENPTPSGPARCCRRRIWRPNAPVSRKLWSAISPIRSSPPTSCIPKVFTDFARATETYGPVGVLPTPVYFYGIQGGRRDRHRA
jgi:pyruvate carboxylase